VLRRSSHKRSIGEQVRADCSVQDKGTYDQFPYAFVRDAQVPTNLRLIAVPLYELYDNAANFGPVIAAVPHMIGRFRLNMAGAAPEPLALPAANGSKGDNKAAAPADDDELALQLYGGA